MDELDDLIGKARGAAGSFSLTGKRALVVGGNRGLGQAMALALASAGADVCVAGRGPEGAPGRRKPSRRQRVQPFRCCPYR